MAVQNGTGGPDKLNGTTSTDTVNGYGGHDFVQGHWGDDVVYGGSGVDIATGSSGDDTVYGGSGHDGLVEGNRGDDLVYGGSGDDRIVIGQSGEDTLYGGQGSDYVGGRAGHDTVFGDSGDDTIDGGSGNDILDGGDGNDTAVGSDGDDFVDGKAGYDVLDVSALTVGGATVTIDDILFSGGNNSNGSLTHDSGTITFQSIEYFRFEEGGVLVPVLEPCFTAGTLIDTDQGPITVETLQPGDMIRTKDHGFQPVKWVGGSRVMDAPVRIAKGPFGNERDLIVSPRHRMLLQGWQMGLLFNHDEAFAAAKDMQNGTSITMETEGWVTYYHVLLDRHEVIYAEGAETESFFPDEASLNGMARKTREELAQTVDLSTFSRTARPTLTANQAMYLSHNMDLLADEQGQIAAE